MKPAVPPTPLAAGALRLPELVLLGLTATLARIVGLGTYSLWLDEVLILLRATAGGPAAVWAACRANAEHPPLVALVMAGGHALGLSETGQRLVPVALGVATVLLLAAWTARRFGRAAGLAAGLVTALLPFHVRYSQELRPYAYLLFFAALALTAGERLLRRPGPRAAGLLALALVGGLYSHLLFPLLAVPLGVLFGEAAFAPRRRGTELAARGRRALAWLGAAWGVALLAFLPWLPALLVLPGRPPGGRVHPWTWSLAAQRWQFLTVGGSEGDGLTWAGVVAFALVVVGMGVAWRRTAGRAALAGLLAGTVGVEVALLAAGHWSNGRYDSLGWIFLPILAALGLAALLGRRRTRPLGAVLLAALLVGELAGLARYARVGRPHWDRVAAAVRAVRRPGEPVLVENEWTRIVLGYYLQGPGFQGRRGEEGAPRVVEGGVPALRRLWPADRAAVLVFGRSPRQRALRHWSWAFPTVARFGGLGGRVVLLTPETRRRLFAEGRRAAGPASPGAAAAAGRLRDLPPELGREPGPASEAVPLLRWLERLGRWP